MSPTLHRAITLAKLSLMFGRVERITRHEDGIRPETDTDHTVMLGLFVLEFAPDWLDKGRLAEFALVHDFPEVFAKDTQTLFISEEEREAKAQREAAAREKLGILLEDRGPVLSILSAYEAQNEPEARFVRLMDKVLPKLLHGLNACVAARALGTQADFETSHRKQYVNLATKYPEFGSALELLGEAMSWSEAHWEP